MKGELRTEGGWARQCTPPARFAPGVIGQIMDGEGSARVPDNVIDELRSREHLPVLNYRMQSRPHIRMAIGSKRSSGLT